MKLKILNKYNIEKLVQLVECLNKFHRGYI